MKKVGILGGMSWESSAKYYEWLNQGIRERLGGLNSARVLLSSVNFQEIEHMQASGDWAQAGDVLAAEAQNLEQGGADFIILATNTMHRVADKITSAVTIPFIHLATATADRIDKGGLTKIGLLGTRYTMEQDFYKRKLEDRGINVLVPDQQTRADVNRVIYEELCLGVINPSSKTAFMRAAQGMVDAGAQGVILGCTEITMLINQGDFTFPVFDTTKIHVETAIDYMLAH